MDHIDAQVQALVRNLIIPRELLDAPEALASRRFGLHSQFEEDGIALSLHAAAGTRTRRFVEIGCGTNGGNSGILAAELGWEGLMVDANAKAVAEAKLLNPRSITGVAARVTRENVNSLITENGFAGDIDQLSIDIDGNDYWILESLTACRPRVLILEYNSAFGPSAKATVPYAKNFVRPLDDELSRLYFGASISALEELAREKGYGLVAVEPHGANAFFLADDVATEIPRRRPEDVYRTLRKHTEAAHDSDLFRRLTDAGMPLVKPEPSETTGAHAEIVFSGPTRAESRAAFFDEAVGNAELLGVGTRWGTFVVSTGDRTVGRSLFTRRVRGEMSVLDRAAMLLESFGVPRRPVFVDCGANIGTTTISALHSSGFERAFALEPEPSNFRLLKANLALNDLDERTIARQVAVSSTAGTLELRIHPTNWGGHEIVAGGTPPSLKIPARTIETVQIEAVTLDDLVDAGTLVPSDIGLLWLNVQGHEGAILAGGEQVLATKAPVVFQFFPAMLERAGGLEDIYRLAETYYETFVDMRTVTVAGDGLEANRRPVDELREMGAVIAAGERRFTDVLVLAS